MTTLEDAGVVVRYPSKLENMAGPFGALPNGTVPIAPEWAVLVLVGLDDYFIPNAVRGPTVARRALRIANEDPEARAAVDAVIRLGDSYQLAMYAAQLGGFEE